MALTKKTIEVAGKVYGYWTYDNGDLVSSPMSDTETLVNIRSENNPYKMPYLRSASPAYNKVLKAIKAQV